MPPFVQIQQSKPWLAIRIFQVAVSAAIGGLSMHMLFGDATRSNITYTNTGSSVPYHPKVPIVNSTTSIRYWFLCISSLFLAVITLIDVLCFAYKIVRRACVFFNEICLVLLTLAGIVIFAVMASRDTASWREPWVDNTEAAIIALGVLLFLSALISSTIYLFYSKMRKESLIVSNGLTYEYNVPMGDVITTQQGEQQTTSTENPPPVKRTAYQDIMSTGGYMRYGHASSG